MDWTQEKIELLVKEQQDFFQTNVTLDVNWRKKQLKKLKQAMRDYESELIQALKKDLGRSETEAFFCDIGTVILEINETLRGIKRWSKPELHFSGLACFPSIFTRVYKMPYGTTLIISPFNFPILLSFGVLIAAIAGGNTAIIKASSKSPHCTAIMQKIISAIYPPEYISVIDGSHDIADICLEQRFDKIFYTGSPKVAKHIATQAAKNLTPIALELGGKTGNWCIVRKDANIEDVARKIAFFKMCNAGQICININQVAVAEEIAEDFVKALKDAFQKQIGPCALDNPEYPHLINKSAYSKCQNWADQYAERVAFGGKGNVESLQFEPTIIYPVDKNETIVTQELFNPLLPVIPFKDNNVEEIIDCITQREHGLALYIFTKDKRWAKRIMSTQQYGGGCINEVCLHLIVKGAPFNGTGHAGMGAYHGKWGFREFTHPTTVLFGSTRFNLSLREHPYSGKQGKHKLKVLRLFER